MECPVKSRNNNEKCPSLDNNVKEGETINIVAETSLPSERIASSIPRSEGEGGNWLYPSQKMFFSAMQRKGHQPNEADMEIIVNIHNMVNEQTWQQILKWENYYHHSSNGVPRLQRFLGRPSDISPKALFRSFILGYKKPFDRHDWFVEGVDGAVRRYVIDFYAGKGSDHDNSLPSFYIDARPAVDNLTSVYTRLHCCWKRTSCSVQRIWQQFINKVDSQ